MERRGELQFRLRDENRAPAPRHELGHRLARGCASHHPKMTKDPRDRLPPAQGRSGPPRLALVGCLFGALAFGEAVAAPVWASCASPGGSPALLPDLPKLELVAMSKASTGQCFLEVHYDPVCIPNLPVISAKMDGLPLTPVDHLSDPGSPSCDRGQVFKCPQSVIGFAEPASFYVTDGANTALFQVDQLTTTRTLALTQPTDGLLRAGDVVLLEVRPAVADLSTQPLAVRLRDDQRQTIVFTIDSAHGLSAGGSRLSFTVPAGLPRGVAGHLELDRSLDLPVLTCTIAERCRASTLSSAPQPVAVRTAP